MPWDGMRHYEERTVKGTWTDPERKVRIYDDDPQTEHIYEDVSWWDTKEIATKHTDFLGRTTVTTASGDAIYPRIGQSHDNLDNPNTMSDLNYQIGKLEAKKTAEAHQEAQKSEDESDCGRTAAEDEEKEPYFPHYDYTPANSYSNPTMGKNYEIPVTLIRLANEKPRSQRRIIPSHSRKTTFAAHLREREGVRFVLIFYLLLSIPSFIVAHWASSILCWFGVDPNIIRIVSSLVFGFVLIRIMTLKVND